MAICELCEEQGRVVEAKTHRVFLSDTLHLVAVCAACNNDRLERDRRIGVQAAIVEIDGQDYQLRAELNDMAFERLERDTNLSELMTYWQSQASRSLPLERRFMANYPATLTEASFWVEVSAADPLDYVVRAHTGWTSYGDSSEVTLKEHPNPSNADAIALEYLEAKMQLAPMYHEVHQSFNGNVRRFTKLTVPVVDDFGNVSRLFIAPRLITESYAWATAAPIWHRNETTC